MILKISNAVAAIIEVKDHGILFQERDNKKIYGTLTNLVCLEEV